MSSEIKVSSVKAKDGTAGISIADSTGRVSFTETNPSITLGSNATLGANVVFNDAHKDISKDDYVMLGLDSNVAVSSDGLISSSAIWHNFYKGSNITHPYHPTSTAEYGMFKVAKAGFYLVWANLHNNGNHDISSEIYLRRNNYDLNHSNHSVSTRMGSIPRLYINSGAEIGYPTLGAKLWGVLLDANDYLHLHGSGDFYGDGNSTMGIFGAVRLGAL